MRLAIKLLLSMALLAGVGQTARADLIMDPVTRPQGEFRLDLPPVLRTVQKKMLIYPRIKRSKPQPKEPKAPSAVSQIDNKVDEVKFGAVCAASGLALAFIYGGLWAVRRPTH